MMDAMSSSWKKEIIRAPSDRAPATRTPASAHAVRVGPLVFVTGQSGRQPGGADNYSDDPAEQARQTMENIKAILEEAGTSLEHAIKRTVIVGHPSMLPKIRPVLESYFTSPVASTTLQGCLMREEKVLEVEVIALVPEPAP